MIDQTSTARNPEKDVSEHDQMNEKFREFTTKFELTEARLCGDGIFLSAAEYWRWANRMSQLFVREGGNDYSQFPGFIGAVDGFSIYLDNRIAGTGLTIETELELPGYLARLDAE